MTRVIFLEEHHQLQSWRFHKMDRHQAIRNTHENVKTINGDHEAWDEAGNKINLNESLITSEMERLKSEFDSLSWERSRKVEYPSIQDCIHALLDGGDALTELQAKRTAIKEKYPKPT